MAGGLIGALHVTLGIDTAAFEAGSRRARETAARDAGAIGKSYGAMKTAISGLMAGITVGAIYAKAKEGLEYASSLQEVAQQLGVTTKDLQEYRYAATQVGISQEEMDKGLAKLTVTMGKAREGAKEPVAAFKALSDVLGKDILTNAATAGDAIPLIADALARVEDPARRAALEVSIFGKTGQKLDTLLSGGSAAVNELRDAAQSLGVVLSDEQLANADKTADKLSELSQVLSANIAGAVADNAKSVYDLADGFVQLAKSMLDAAGAAARYRKLSVVDSGRSLRGRFDADIQTMIEGFAQGRSRGGISEQAVYDLTHGSRADRQALLTQTAIRYNASKSPEERRLLRERRKNILQAEVDAAKASQTPRGGEGGAGAGAGSGGGSRRRGGRRAGGGGHKIDPAKQTERYQQEMARLEDEQLRLEADLSNNAADRSTLAKRRIDNERDAYVEELAAKVKAGELTALQAKRLEAGKKFNAGLETDVEVQRAADAVTREALDTDNARLDLAADLKRGAMGEARTQADRRQMQLELLDIEYDRQRAALNAVLALNSSTDAEKEIARARLAQLDTLKGQEARGVTRDTMGPMEAFRDGLHRTAGQIQEDFEQIQVDGIKSLNDGLVDAIMNSKSLGEVFSNVANQIVSDLIRIASREAMSSIFGGGSGGAGGGGAGGLFSGLSSLFGGGGHTLGGASISNSLFKGLSQGNGVTSGPALPGLAVGGTIRGFPGIDTNLLSINGMPVARVNTGETIRVEPNDRGGGAGRPLVFDLRGAVMTEDLMQQMQRIANDTTQGGIDKFARYQGRAMRQSF